MYLPTISYNSFQKKYLLAKPKNVLNLNSPAIKSHLDIIRAAVPIFQTQLHPDLTWWKESLEKNNWKLLWVSWFSGLLNASPLYQVMKWLFCVFSTYDLNRIPKLLRMLWFRFFTFSPVASGSKVKCPSAGIQLCSSHTYGCLNQSTLWDLLSKRRVGKTSRDMHSPAVRATAPQNPNTQMRVDAHLFPIKRKT